VILFICSAWANNIHKLSIRKEAEPERERGERERERELFLIPSSYKDTHPWISMYSNPVQVNLHLIRSTKTVFPNKMIFTSIEG
jgi:hypothetical protein